jgi:hypothetical protein
MLSDQQIKEFFSALSSSYNLLDYNRFCELMNFDPAYDQEYFKMFQKGVQYLFQLDPDNLKKVIRYGQGGEK